MIYVKAQKLCQGSDEDLLLTMGEIIYPGFVRRHEGENGLRLWVEGTAPYDGSRTKAEAQFQTLLGVLRAWRSVAGELVVERLGGLGQGGAAGAADGRQWIELRPAIVHVVLGGEDRNSAEKAAVAINRNPGIPAIISLIGGDEVRIYAKKAAVAIKASPDIRNALLRNGRANRTAANLYMIHEHACIDLGGGPKNLAAVADKLGISVSRQRNLKQSANSGRHAEGQEGGPWTLEEQLEFTADLLRRWIAHLDRKSVAEQAGIDPASGPVMWDSHSYSVHPSVAS